MAEHNPMTDIDQAVVEKFGGYGLRCYTCDASGRNVEHTSWKFTRDELREAMIAINLPDLLRKEREYDALIAAECAWDYDDHSDSWDSACGEKYQFISCGPAENGVRFCHGCGKRVRLLVEQEG